MESLDSFLLLSSFLEGGSRKRLRFSGTDAAARPLGIELDTELEPGYNGTKRWIMPMKLCYAIIFYTHSVFLLFHVVRVTVTVPVICRLALFLITPL